MRVQYALFFVFLFIGHLSFGQQDKVVIRFMDEVKGKPLQNVVVADKTGATIARGDSAGYAIVPLSRFNTRSFVIALYAGYKPDTLFAAASTVYMQPLSVTLKETIIGSNKVSMLLCSPTEYVVDYDFAGDNVVVATYSGSNGNKAKLFLLNRNGDVLGNCKVPDEPVSLFKSCVNKCYCVCSNEFYPLEMDGNTVSLRNPYNSRLLPGLMQCECSAKGNAYYRVGDKTNFTMQYGMIAKGDSVFKPIAKFEEKDIAFASFENYIEIIELLEAGQFKAAARKQKLRDMWDNGSFAHINMPLFMTGDTLVIFDFFNKRIRCYTLSGQPAGSTPIGFEWKQSQKFEVIKDEVGNKFYIHRYKNQSAQTIEELNINSGEPVSTTTLIDRPFAERVKVHDGTIYFLWQEKNSGKIRQLFTQKMK